MRRGCDKYISVYVRNSKEGPSCYYRIIQYLETIKGLNYKINNGFFLWEYRINLNCRSKWYQHIFQAYAYVSLCIKRFASIIYDLHRKPYLIIVQRESVPRHMPFLLGILWNRLLSLSTVIWDYDDDIFGSEISLREKKMLEEKSRTIVVTSAYLRDLLDLQYRDKAITLPTTDQMITTGQLEEVLGNRKRRYEKEISVIWVGTAANLNYLWQILGYMENAALLLKSYHKRLTLVVVCNRFLDYEPKNFDIKNIKWSRKVAKKEIIKAHIGIMPLAEEDFAKGKGGFKLVQYVSSALPVIGTNIGFNSEIITGENGFLIGNAEKEKWVDAIIALSTDIGFWETCSRNAIKIYKEKFSVHANAAAWHRLIENQGQE